MPHRNQAESAHHHIARDRHSELPFDPDTPEQQQWPLHLRVGALGLVFVGGAAGTLGRHELSLIAPTRAHHWPWGTFVANMIGTFVLGVLLEALARLGPDDGWRRRMRILIGTGACGGLTTYSTLAVEADLLFRDRAAELAIGYLGTTLVAGLLATICGIALAARWRRRQGGADSEGALVTQGGRR